MTSLTLFLPCAGGVEDFLADEVHGLTGLAGDDLLTVRGGVRVRAGWAEAMRLNLHSRLAQRVLIELAHGAYRDEHDLYALAAGVAWEDWFTPRQTFRVDVTAQSSPLKSLNFATLRIKDAVADRFRQQAGGVRPSVETQRPDVTPTRLACACRRTWARPKPRCTSTPAASRCSSAAGGRTRATRR